MTSKIKVDNINKVSDDSNIIKKCGTTTTIGSGASNPIVVDGSAVTIGRCGGTVALASGASQTGFGRTGTVDWQTTIKTGDFTASNGEGYFINTTSGEVDVTLPAGSAGSIIAVADYANTADTNNIILKQNGSDKIEGSTDDFIINAEGAAATLVFADSTKGWIVTDTGNSSNLFGETFISATGGNSVVECGNCKIHTFTGPGTFCVASISNSAANNEVSYLVIAGGGGGGQSNNGPNKTGGAGGGAGGFRESKSPLTPYTASPLDGRPNSPNRVTVTATGFPITVGGGGTGGHPGPAGTGSNSTFSTITSAAGGGGKSDEGTSVAPGGSGGGAGAECGSPVPSGGTGNDPPTSPSQGNPGHGSPGSNAGGGGGAGAAGGNNAGGAGETTSITGSAVTRAGGGGGAGPTGGGGGGPGGGGNGGANGNVAGSNGSANTGGGGGGAGGGSSNTPGSVGGSGIVVIRYKFQ